MIKATSDCYFKKRKDLMYATTERRPPNDEIDQIYQEGGFNCTHVPWHGLSLLMGIHPSGNSFPFCSTFLVPDALLKDVTPPLSRVLGITVKMKLFLS